MREQLSELYRFFLGPEVLIAPQYMAGWLLIVWIIYRMRRETVGFFKWAFPSRIWRHRSSLVDFVLFVLGQSMAFLGILSRFVATPVVAAAVAGMVPWAATGSDTSLHPILLALILFLSADFASYWSHRAHHTISAIWPLHAVHHSAEVLTPITAYRHHPLSILVNLSFQSIVIGALWGLLIGVFDHSASLATIAGANAFVVIANITVANFHHAHIWVSFGPFWERVFMSPAQHHIHHSTNPDHFNTNYGQILSVWDWMFGTLYVTESKESVSFGLDSKADAPLMTQQLWPIMWTPLKRMFGR